MPSVSKGFEFVLLKSQAFIFLSILMFKLLLKDIKSYNSFVGQIPWDATCLVEVPNLFEPILHF